MNNIVAQKIERCEKERIIINNRKVSLIEKLHKISEIMEAESTIKILTAEIVDSKKVIDAGLRIYSELKPIVQSKSVFADNISKEINSLESELAPTLSNVDQLDLRIKNYESKNVKINDLKKNISNYEKEENNFKLEIEKLKSGIKLLNIENPQIKEKIATDTENLKVLRLEVSDLDRQILKVSNDLKSTKEIETKKKSILKFEEENKETVEKTDRMEKSNESNKILLNNITVDIENSNKEVTCLVENVDKLSSKIFSLEKNVISKEESEKIKYKVNIVLKERNELFEKITKIETEIKSHTDCKGDMINMIEEAEKSFKYLKDEFKDLRERVEPYLKDPSKINLLENKISGLENEKIEFEKRIKESEEEIGHLNRALDILIIDHTTYKDAMNDITEMLKI